MADLLHMCAPCFELQSNISTMVGGVQFEHGHFNTDQSMTYLKPVDFPLGIVPGVSTVMAGLLVPF